MKRWLSVASGKRWALLGEVPVMRRVCIVARANPAEMRDVEP
jgi:hypothetical protein